MSATSATPSSDPDADVLRGLDARVQRARDDAAVLERVLEALESTHGLFSVHEVAAVRAAQESRVRAAHADAAELAHKRSIYSSRVLKLRELIGRRQAVIDALHQEHGILDRFPAETEVIVDTQASLALDLMHAEADLVG